MGGEVGMSLVVKSSHCLPSVRLMGFRAWGLFCIAVSIHLFTHRTSTTSLW